MTANHQIILLFIIRMYFNIHKNKYHKTLLFSIYIMYFLYKTLMNEFPVFDDLLSFYAIIKNSAGVFADLLLLNDFSLYFYHVILAELNGNIRTVIRRDTGK